ncbi:transferase [Anaerolineales bacterium]
MSRWTIKNLNDDPNFSDSAYEISCLVWKDFMQNNDCSGKIWGPMEAEMGENHIVILDGERHVATANTMPVYWDGDLQHLPPEGWDWEMTSGWELHQKGEKANTLGAISINIHPDYQGQGLSYEALKQMRLLAQAKGFRQLIAPVRPTFKSLYPLMSMTEYLHWRRPDGLPFDPWLRAHERVGGQIIKEAPFSMTITGSVEEWESWAKMRFPFSGSYYVEGALNPVQIDISSGRGVYIEPNVWVLHRIEAS